VAVFGAAGLPQEGLAAAGRAEVAAPSAQPPSGPKGVEVELSGSHEDLTNGFDSWISVQLDVRKKFAPKRSLHGSLRQTRRFGLRDQELTAGGYLPLAKRWTLLAEASASPSHRVLPRWSALGQVSAEAGSGWVGHLGLRHSEFETATTDMTLLTAERYWKSWRGAYALAVNRLRGAGTATSHSLQASYYYTDTGAIGLAVAAGRELENLGPAGILETRTRAVTLVGRQSVGSRWAVTYDLGLTDQGDLYTRRSVRVGLRHQF